jgi:hypothetical protein
MADPSYTQDSEILPSSPPQKILSRYQTDFAFHHDRGFYLSAGIGPQWNHSLDKPNAKGIRFGGKINAGWYVADRFSLFASLWGNFLEAASLIAGGPGVAFLFDSTNISLDFSLGIGRAFNAIERNEIKNFAESVLATNLSIGKFWWLSEKTSMGITLSSGIHGLTLSEGKVSTFGWNAGLGLAFILG